MKDDSWKDIDMLAYYRAWRKMQNELALFPVPRPPSGRKNKRGAIVGAFFWALIAGMFFYGQKQAAPFVSCDGSAGAPQAKVLEGPWKIQPIGGELGELSVGDARGLLQCSIPEVQWHDLIAQSKYRSRSGHRCSEYRRSLSDGGETAKAYFCNGGVSRIETGRGVEIWSLPVDYTFLLLGIFVAGPIAFLAVFVLASDPSQKEGRAAFLANARWNRERVDWITKRRDAGLYSGRMPVMIPAWLIEDEE